MPDIGDGLRRERHLARLRAYASRWGGDVVASERGDQLNAPFSGDVGVDYRARLVFFRPSVIPHIVHAAVLIHEMGHVFASRRPPSGTAELRFLGWEYAVARKTGMVREWLASNARYCINYGSALELRDLSGKRLQRFLETRLNASRRLGLVRGDEPLSTLYPPVG